MFPAGQGTGDRPMPEIEDDARPEIYGSPDVRAHLPGPDGAFLYFRDAVRDAQSAIALHFVQKEKAGEKAPYVPQSFIAVLTAEAAEAAIIAALATEQKFDPAEFAAYAGKVAACLVDRIKAADARRPGEALQ